MAQNKKKITFDERTLIFSFFVIIASALWFLNKMSEEYSTSLSFKLRLSNSKTNEIYTLQPNDYIHINAKASGFFILKQRFLSKNLNIDLKDKPMIKSGNTLLLPTYLLKDRVSDIFGQKVRINTIEPDTLILNFNQPSKKIVPIKANIKLFTQQEYMQTNKIEFNPDSITITGLPEIIDTISYIETNYYEYKDLSDNIETSVTLKEIDNVAFSQRKVKFSVPIERCTESEIKIPISVINVPESLSVILLPPQVTIKYIVSLKEYPNIRRESFFAAVDYNMIDSLPGKKLKVNLIHTPPQALSIVVEPEFVDFIQRKN